MNTRDILNIFDKMDAQGKAAENNEVYTAIKE